MARRLTTDEFITKATSVHGNTYNYSAVNYTSGRNKVIIKCSIHGEFEQQPSAHLNGQGCPTCSGRGNYQHPTFIKLATIKHKNKYVYSVTDDITANTYIPIVCQVHGVFNQRASSHLEGVGCKECMYDAKATTYSDFVNRAMVIHGEYVYPKDSFSIRRREVDVICKAHGMFTQDKSNHLQKHGCPMCYTPGFDKDKPGILYYLKITTSGNILWKIGITNRSVDERFTVKDLQSIEVLYQHTFTKGIDASTLEKEILEAYSEFRYKGDKVLRDGNTELFTKDIFINILNDQKCL